MAKRFILNADDFGVSKAANNAVLEAYEYGLLKSVSLTANGEMFEEAVDNMLQKCPEICAGVHLNLTSGKSLCSDVNLLTDEKMNFSNTHLSLLIKSLNPKMTDFLPQIEREFRRQIEKVMSKTKVYHLDSHSQIHSIPPIFDMVCRLAKEYKIPYVITHFEKFYFIPDLYRHFSREYCKNLAKKFVLNLLTVFNENTIKKYNLKTNDYIIGTEYASTMDALSVSYGLKALKYDNITVETFIHPHRYEEGTIDNYFDEYLITRNYKLKDKILRSGYDITNYKEDIEETADNIDEK